MHRNAYLLSPLIIGLSFSSFSTFSSQDKDNIENEDIEVVVTTANRNQSLLFSQIGNTSLINQDDIERTNAQHLNQLLGQSSGAWLSRGNGQESLISLRSPVLTGAGSCAEFLTMENGIALRASGFCNVNQLFDTHFEQADRIEVMKGSNSARYGSNAIHGLINVFSPAFKNEARTSIETGSNGFMRFNGLIGYQSEQQEAFNLAFTSTIDGGYKDSAGYEQQKLSANYQHQLGNWQVTHRFATTNLAQDTAGYLQAGKDAYEDKSLLKTNTFEDAYRNARSVRISSHFRLDSKHMSWQVTPYMRWNEMDFLMHFLPGQPVEKNGHQSAGIQVKNSLYLRDNITYDIGIDAEWTTGYLEQTQFADTQSSSAFLRGVLPKGAHYDYDVDAMSAALYNQLNWKISESTSAFSAVRFDLIEYDYQNHLLDGNTRDDGTVCGFGGCRYTRPASRENSFDDISYSIGVNHKISDDWIAYAKLDNSFRAPHTAEMYRLQNGQNIADINGVTADQVELGLRFNNSYLFVDVSLYDLSKEDGIYQDSDRQYLNGLDTSHRGLEIEAHWKITDTLSAKVNTSIAKHTYDNDLDGKAFAGNEIDTAPRILGNAQLNWQVTDAANIQIEVQHIDDYFLTPENTESYDGHTLLNLSGQWQVNTQWTLSARVLNALDTRYAERADFAFGNHRYFVGEPTSFFVQLSYKM